MEILQKLDRPIPFGWFNYDYYPDSSAFRIILQLIDYDEFDIVNRQKICDAALSLMETSDPNSIILGQSKPDISWGEMTFDGWKLIGKELVFDDQTLSESSNKYLDLLAQSQIDPKYEGFCSCNDWNTLLKIIIECVMSGVAPFSPLIYDLQKERIIYFHHTTSIGIYCKTKLDAELLSHTSDCQGFFAETEYNS